MSTMEPSTTGSVARVKASSGQTMTRYKEKYQNLRERYEQTSQLHEEYLRDLELANEKMKKLQAENELLLDTMYLKLPSQPGLQAILQSMDLESIPAGRVPIPLPIPPEGTYSGFLQEETDEYPLPAPESEPKPAPEREAAGEDVSMYSSAPEEAAAPTASVSNGKRQSGRKKRSVTALVR